MLIDIVSLLSLQYHLIRKLSKFCSLTMLHTFKRKEKCNSNNDCWPTKFIITCRYRNKLTIMTIT